VRSGLIIGIDPGKKGGLVVVDQDMSVVWSAATDVQWVLTKEYDVSRMHSDLHDVSRGASVRAVVLERQWARPTDGKATAFSTGYGYGLWTGVVMALGLPLLTPAPTTWQTVKKGVAGRGKEQSIMCVRQRLPELELVWGRRRKAHDGLADAGCMALWGWREVSG